MELDQNSIEIEWCDEYNIGVDVIDDARRNLFRIVSRIISNFGSHDFDRNKTTCIEAIKYLKTYAAKHFAEEEAYQLKIGYSGYAIHKKIHDNMKNVVIPALEKEMETKGYSKESLEHFAGVCAGWLTAHILIEDRAIVGKEHSKWSRSANESVENALDGIIRGYSTSLFGVNAELLSKRYSGHKLGPLFCYNDVFEMPDGVLYSVTTCIEHSMLETVGRKLVKREVIELDRVMLPLFSEMMKSFNLEVCLAMLNGDLKRVKSAAIPEENFYAQYKDNVYPDYSMIWRTYCGYIAFSTKKL